MPNDRLRDAILRHGLTPIAVAEHVGVDPKTAERWITAGRLPYPRHRYAIAALLRESESYLWPEAFSTDRAARLAHSEVVGIYPRRSTVPGELWRQLLDRATQQVGILVYSGLFLPEQNPKLAKTLRDKARAGLQVRILLGDPDSAQVANRGAEEGIGDAMGSKVRNVLALYRELQSVPGVTVKFHRTTLYNSIYRFDAEMLVNMHVFGFPAAHAPVLHLRQLAGADLFDTYAESFESVWLSASDAWPSTIAR